MDDLDSMIMTCNRSRLIQYTRATSNGAQAGKPYDCCICASKFRKTENLEEHIKNDHNTTKDFARRRTNEAAMQYEDDRRRREEVLLYLEGLPETATVPPNAPRQINSADIPRENVQHERTVDSSNIQMASKYVKGVAELQSPTTSGNHQK